ncbi:TetR family transcriptional regulator [Salinicola acroporae]|uniref:TetR family transcriptional regulator n=1 Tax=Salinicola acroporae TaxID=1541440 RepID=A0ABT6I8P1_9GAMM|nr:TetR family transcriptional regulator [Salinicola acroporae]MDH4574090.1 TetR family transcriptional regulator [Salinicola acroporae]
MRCRQPFTQQGWITADRHFARAQMTVDGDSNRCCASFEALAERAKVLESSDSADEALVAWMQETTEFTYRQRGIIALMMGAIEDTNSALHDSCVMLRAAGTALLTRAQAEGKARDDLSGAELFDLIAALAWLREQPSHAARADHLFTLIADAILTDSSGAHSGGDQNPARRRPPRQRRRLQARAG